MSAPKISKAPKAIQPQHSAGGKRRRIIKLTFFAVLTLMVVVAAVLLLRWREYRAAQDEYSEYQAMAEVNEDVSFIPLVSLKPKQTFPPKTAALSTLAVTATPKPFRSEKVASLLKVNREAVAWLDVVGTQMQYPVVQAKNNEYYMTHTIKKRKNASGAIFLDCWNVPNFTDFNTVIYGHNMNDGSMFSGLRDYRHQKFFDEHLTVEITLLDKKLTYHVFAAYTSQGVDGADFRGQECFTEAERSTFIKAVRKQSTDLDSSETVSRHDRLLTLVTCTSGTHSWYWVVHAVLVEEQFTQ